MHAKGNMPRSSGQNYFNLPFDTTRRSSEWTGRIPFSCYYYSYNKNSAKVFFCCFGF